MRVSYCCQCQLFAQLTSKDDQIIVFSTWLDNNDWPSEDLFFQCKFDTTAKVKRERNRRMIRKKNQSQMNEGNQCAEDERKNPSVIERISPINDGFYRGRGVVHRLNNDHSRCCIVEDDNGSNWIRNWRCHCRSRWIPVGMAKADQEKKGDQWNPMHFLRRCRCRCRSMDKRKRFEWGRSSDRSTSFILFFSSFFFSLSLWTLSSSSSSSLMMLHLNNDRTRRKGGWKVVQANIDCN